MNRQNRQPNTQYVLSLSYGKDSLATLEAIRLLGYPLDRIVHAEIWATDTIPADLPPMVEFKQKADKIIKERYEITVEHLRAEKTYEDIFYSIAKANGSSKNSGHICGFPMTKGAWCNSRLKVKTLRKIDRNSISYIGIAYDEPKRFKTFTETRYSPLVDAEWTEKMCFEWCKKNDLLSPIYQTSARGGCWFCHYQSIDQLRLLRRNYPDLWALLLKWDGDSPVSFHLDGHTVHDIDKRIAAEEAELVPTDRSFRWKMLDGLEADVKVNNKNEKKEEKEMTAQFDLGAMLETPIASTENQIKQIPCDMLVPYHNHKFELYSGERLDDMVESIRENGVLIPIIVQPLNGKYEILIGHNRWNASKLAGEQTVPSIIKEGLTEEEAEMYVIESNLMQRGFDNLKISEQAAVIAIRHSQMFSQGKRNDILRELALFENPKLADDETLSPMDTKSDTNRQLGEEYGMSRATVARLIRIDKLNDDLKSYVDNGKLSVRAGVQLSYLDKVTQAHICSVIEDYKIDMLMCSRSRRFALQIRSTINFPMN